VSKPVAGSKMALTVLMFSCVGATEEDPTVRIEDPVGPRLFRRGDGKYGFAGRFPFAHPVFRKMIERSDPGAYGFNVGRLLHMDHAIREEAARGLDQLVILGAGYDTRAYRMGAELGGARVFEVDLPLMSADKRARVTAALGSLPEDVHYVEVDFNGQDPFARLAEWGYEESARTLFVLSGVSMYLPEEAVRKLLCQVAAQRARRASILFDYMYDDLLTEPERYPGAVNFLARTRDVGERIRYGVSEEDLPALVESCGLELASQHDMSEVAERHLRRTDGTLVAEPYRFAAVAHAYSSSS
jgi:methyltransferase (TIGR00027 family)